MLSRQQDSSDGILILAMIDVIAVISAMAIVVYAIIRLGKPMSIQKNLPEEKLTDRCYADLSESIEKLNLRKRSIDTMNDMIADIWECAPGLCHKTIIVRIPENGHEYQFTLNGEDDISDLFVEIFETEREINHTSLRQEISKIN